MAAATYDITIEQGATFPLPLLWKDADDAPISLVGISARMQIRQKYTSPAPVVSLTSDPGGGIVLTDPGQIDITITDEQTAAIPFKEGVYDLELEFADGHVERLLKGTVTVSPEVTK